VPPACRSTPHRLRRCYAPGVRPACLCRLERRQIPGAWSDRPSLANCNRFAQDTRVRVACWLFVACAVVASIAMFVPAVQLEVGGAAVSHRTAESIFQIDTNKGFARRVLARYRESRGAHVGKQIMTHAMPHTGKTLRGHLDDVTSAMSTLDDVS